MTPVLTVSQMRAVDEAAIAGNTARGFHYMTLAGKALFDAVVKTIPDPQSGEIAIVCGKGNNGGDGFLAGTLLMDAGYRTTCYALYPAEEFAKEARIAYDGYVAREGVVVMADDVSAMETLCRHALIIDAVLGTGSRGSPRGMCADAIRAINACGVAVIAADTPSGMDSDTGNVGDPCIKASTTVTMGFPKIGQFFYPGRACTGELVVGDLGYPADIVNGISSRVFFPSRQELRGMLPRRKPDGSKRDHGVCLMVSGSRGMTGAAQLASTAAMRTGCGMVHLFLPQSQIDILGAKVTEVVLREAPQTDEGTIALEAFDRIMEVSRSMHCLCIGPGLSCNGQTMALVRRLVAQVEIPVVLDADGLNAFRDHVADLMKHKAPLIITPHAGEWARLFGALPQDPSESFHALQRVAAQYDLTVLYKGSPSQSAAPDGTCAVLPFGNSGMATAGSGDVLAGIIASLISQGCPVPRAAVLGAYLHGSAGDCAAQDLGEYSMIASDIIKYIYKAIKGVM